MKTAFTFLTTPRPQRKKLISKSLDNKQRKNGKKILRRKALFKQTLDEMRDCFYGKRPEDPIEIESTKSENLDYEILEFENINRDKKFSFKCYSEKDLKFPADYSKQIISRTCDDDCSTDDEQINYAIGRLYDSLKSVASERRKLKYFRKS